MTIKRVCDQTGEYGSIVKQRFIVITLFLLLIMPGLAAFTPVRKAQSGIELSVRAGYSGHYRSGQWVPVQVSVSNAGDDLNGVIRVRTNQQSSQEVVTYRTPIDLPRGARKQLFLYISPNDYEELQVEVVNQKGRVIERQPIKLTLVGSNDILYAVVTASSYGTVDLTALYPGTGYAYQSNWRLDDIPPSSDALAGLDVLMFHDVDTGTLSTEHMAAITEWVLAGGHLIVAGGEAWQRTTAGLLPLLPVALQGTRAVGSMESLADYLARPSVALAEGMTVTNNTPHISARVLAMVEDIPVIVRDRMGSGVVDFLAVDPHAEPLRSWSDKQYLWYTLVASVGQQPSWADGFVHWHAAREATLTTFSGILPTVFQLCGFLAVYIALLGPVNYLVLRRFKHREWAWFTIPVLILVFSVLAYTVGFNLRGTMPTVNRLTVVRVWENSEQAQVMSAIGVQSPRRITYDVAVEQGYTLRVLPERGVGLNVPVVIDQGTRYMAESLPIDGGTVASFVASGYTTVPRLEAEATWHLDDTQFPHITGQFTNTTGVLLEDVVFLIKGEARLLGTIDPGETTNFDITLGAQDAGMLSLGHAAPSYKFNTYNVYYSGPYSAGYLGAMSLGCVSHSGNGLTIRDVMHEDFECYSNHVTTRQQEIRRRYRLLGALIRDIDLSGGRGDGAYVLAWTDQAITEVNLLDKAHNEEDTTLYIFDLPVTVETSTATSIALIEVPPGLTTWSVAELNDPNTLRDLSPTSQFQLSAGNQAAFQFMPMPRMRLAMVEELIIKFSAQGNVIVELWDWPAQNWVEVDLNPDEVWTTIPDASRFVGPENAVKFRISAKSSGVYNSVDYIKLAYRGRLAG